MLYEMEELVPIVGRLAEKYTAYESSSMTYEKAEQLMEAVLYCIHEAEQSGHNSVIPTGGISAQQAYDTGLVYVQEKAKKALDLYNRILPEFVYYKNCCLHDTVINGLPEFFKWYDIQFEPQNSILTLDYPILRDISGYTGIDKVYEFIVCICLEQEFLKIFPQNYVINVLSKYNRQYKDMIENICEIVFIAVIGHILAEKPLSEPDFLEKDYLYIQKIFMQTDMCDIMNQLKDTVKAFVYKYYGNSVALLEYLTVSIDGVAVRLRNAACNDSLHQIL